MTLSAWWKYIYQKSIKKVLLALVFSVFLIILVSRPDETLFTAHSRQLLSFSLQQHFQEIDQSCPPKKHVLFLKTHKCGSSTVQNIFLRYGYKHNLTFALPSKGNYLGNPRRFQASMLPPSLVPSNGVVDIFCVHSRLNEMEMRRVLHDDALWVTVIREPVELFESLFNYFHLINFYRLELEEFPDVPLKELERIRRTTNKFGKNQMLFDLGVNEDLTIAELQEAIQNIDDLFDVVMIAERMDESLVLLRNQLCWDKEDIVYFTKNARQVQFKPNITRRTEATLTKLNSADKILYDHFLAKHELNVASFGYKRMQEEIAELTRLRSEAYEHCLVTEVNGKDSRLLFEEYSDLVTGYALSNDSHPDCLLLTYPELPFINMVRDKQAQLLINNSAPQRRIHKYRMT